MLTQIFVFVKSLFQRKYILLSDKPSRQARPSRPRRALSNHPKIKNKSGHWSDAQKIEAVTTYLALGGSVRLTAATLKIPDTNIYAWRRTEWWHNLEEEIKKEERLTLSNNLKRLVDKSLEAISDRLENGDWIYDQKTGEMKRKPVAMKDAAKVATDFIDKRIKIESKESFTVAQENIQDKLNQLAKSFSELASKKPELIAQDIAFKEVEQNEASEHPEGG